MASKLIPARPDDVMVIRNVTSNITTLSTPFKRFGRISVGGRGTLVRLPNGSVAVFSPVALTPRVQETVARMGEVKYIVAPDMEHHIFLGAWHAAYPGAKILGPEGLGAKRAASEEHVNVPLAVEYTSSNANSVTVDEAFDAAFDAIYVPAHANKELVFNYRPDKTLIEADLMFNLPATEQMSRTGEQAPFGLLTKIFGQLTHTRGEAMGQRRFVWHAMSAKDRVGFGRSVEQILAWDWDRIIPCHGDVIETGGKGVLEKVMRWNLEAAKQASQAP